ncbi:MAG: hypothetical protein JSS32_09990 [Verrucomicrobia bacterium]|nr:hypothetical protein [Verrucomicrobiota bacterium]
MIPSDSLYGPKNKIDLTDDTPPPSVPPARTASCLARIQRYQDEQGAFGQDSIEDIEQVYARSGTPPMPPLEDSQGNLVKTSSVSYSQSSYGSTMNVPHSQAANQLALKFFKFPKS